jgi:hypothetical protein
MNKKAFWKAPAMISFAALYYSFNLLKAYVKPYHKDNEYLDRKQPYLLTFTFKCLHVK